jgi:hypothetical protein
VPGRVPPPSSGKAGAAPSAHVASVAATKIPTAERSNLGGAKVSRRSHWRVLAAALGLSLACTSPRASDLSPSSTNAQGWVSGVCKVTQPVAADRVPQRVADEGGASSKWFGNDALWVLLPNGGRIIKAPGEKLEEKFPWVRLLQGTLTIDGRRLDGVAPPARALVPDGYGASGFQASFIAFPKEGCWEITGGIAPEALTLVVEVRRG